MRERIPDSDIVWVDGVGIIQAERVGSDQNELYKEFGINFEHFASQDSFYKRLKHEFVVGFSGTEGDDSEHMYTALLTLFLLTNLFFWLVIVGFLSGQSPWFRQLRERPL